MKGLENAIHNLNSLDTRMVPQASAWAINRVAQESGLGCHPAGCREYRCGR
ncbi:Minor tail protein Z (GPZ) of prophage [Escherichia coli]|uniref:Minor tail protein Z (GPZ) of prophage n=1 Tax=Escherichia coli TaxID=562 RepID=A0A376TF90_ECOLX|nr:Minor tail protein Z (GPZ) of prophage [Escherichia coli]